MGTARLFSHQKPVAGACGSHRERAARGLALCEAHGLSLLQEHRRIAAGRRGEVQAQQRSWLDLGAPDDGGPAGATSRAHKKHLVNDPRDRIVATAGLPFNTPGCANAIRVIEAGGLDCWGGQCFYD